MVNEQNIDNLMEMWFTVMGTWSLNDKGLVDVNGSVYLKPHPLGSWTRIPLPFGRVSASFEASDVGLLSLENSPKYVGLNFRVEKNLLISLAHAPGFVGKDFDAFENLYLTRLDCAHTVVGNDLDVQKCNLTNLDNCAQVEAGLWVKGNKNLTNIRGIPYCAHLFIDYHPELALLPALKVNEINVRNIGDHFPHDPDAPKKLLDIVRKYAGTGKSGALNCALELKKAGFAGNARW